MITILQISAIGNANEILMDTTTPDGTKRQIELIGFNPLLYQLPPDRFRLELLVDGGFNAGVRPLPKPTLVYNAIGEPDRCSDALERAEQANTRNRAIPVLNRAARIRLTQPHRYAERLDGIDGLKVPRTLRLTPGSLSELQTQLEHGGLKPPFLVKEAGTPPGESNIFRFQSEHSWNELERFAFDGRAYDVTEYIDTKESDGHYRKYRIYVIGDKFLPGHLIVSTQWRVCDDETAHEDLETTELEAILDEERLFLDTFKPEERTLFAAIRDRLGLDYFSIDFALRDDTVILFGVSCKHHYLSSEKRPGYYSQKQTAVFDHAVERMVLNKIGEGR
jgi:hypothetical protein